MEITPKDIFAIEYDKFGVKVVPQPGFVTNGTANNAGVKSKVGKSSEQTTQFPISPSGNVQSSTSVGYDTGTGWWIGFDKGVPKLFIGNSAGNKLTWDGTTLTINGDLVIGGISRTIGPTDDIQTNLDALNAAGGGTLYLTAGTWMVGTTINGYSSTAIVGVSPSASIIDFNSTAAHLSYAGTNVYSTGTISSITGGVNITGTGTSWLANVHAGQMLFLGTRWYTIAAVLTDTTLTLAESYGDNVSLPSSYRIATVIQNIAISNVGLTGSTGTALTLNDCRFVETSSIVIYGNNKGVVATNVSEIDSDRFASTGNTSNGAELTNVGLSNIANLNAIGNGGHGVVISNVETISIQPFAVSSNTGDGMNITSAIDLTLFGQASGNGANGIQLVATNDNVVIKDGPITGNTADGIKLTATSDDTRIYALDITGNGAYGVNIAASTCDNTLILGNIFAGNTTAAVNDSGTGTLIRSNIGEADN